MKTGIELIARKGQSRSKNTEELSSMMWNLISGHNFKMLLL
ncbi:MAG: hypothetical protein NTZ69_15950 [Bacteroidia bacterium]|nr:hypothetical protein [Bacteroidia bacterium]